VSDVIGGALRSRYIVCIGRKNIEGSWEGRKCRKESRDDVGRQRNVKLSSNPKSELSNQKNVGKRRPGS